MAGDDHAAKTARLLPFQQGNAVADNVAASGWFIGQFVPESLGLRHQDAVELKWGTHHRGDRRPEGAAANGVATTISILVRGVLRTDLVHEGRHYSVTLASEGDYVIFGPEIVHAWEAVEDAVVLSIRFPSVEVGAVRPDATSGRSVE